MSAVSPPALARRRSPHNPSTVVALVALGLLAALALASLSDLLAYHPAAQDRTARLAAPSGEHLFGTDQFGRDVLSRTASGIANSAKIALVAVFIAAVIGTIAGVLGGYLGGLSDTVIGGFTNLLFAFPPLLLALTLAAVLDRTWFTVAVAIAVVYTPIFVRMARGPVLSLREMEYVTAARAAGMGPVGIMRSHILPNLAGIMVVGVTLALSWAVLTEASLSFLGFGTPPPAASLGSMVFEARTLVGVAPWTLIAPGGVLIVLIVGLNLLGDGLRDALDPQRRSR